MYVTYFGKKINTRYTKFVEFGKYAELLKELSVDESISKFTTHLVYMTKSNRKDQIEASIIKSVFDRKPKRADVYWLFHLNRTDNPYALNYEVIELVEGKVFKIIFNIGFRIQPRTELYFKQILTELIKNREYNLHTLQNSSFKYNHELNFHFILLEKYISVENEFSFREGIIIQTYYLLKKFAQKDEKAFGLDKSDVLVEQVPFVYKPFHDLKLVRRNQS